MPASKKPLSKPSTVSTRLSSESHYRLKMYAVQQRRQLLDCLEEAVAEYLKKRGA